MDILEELKKTHLMVLARGVQKDVLLKAALSVLALMPAENVQAFDSLTTRWTFGAHVPEAGEHLRAVHPRLRVRDGLPAQGQGVQEGAEAPFRQP